MANTYRDRIDQRYEHDEASFQHAMESLYIGVTGDTGFRTLNAVEQAQDAIAKVLAYYGATPAPALKGEHDIEALLRHHLDPTGIAYRQVKLPPKWYRDAVGALLVQQEDGTLLALIPHTKGGYTYTDPATGKDVHVTDANLGLNISGTAYCFYRPLPNEELSMRSLVLFILKSLDPRDYAITLLSVMAATALGMMLPVLNKYAFGPVVEAGELSIVWPVGVMLLSVTLAQVLLTAVRNLVLQRVDIKLNVTVKAAIMMRVLSLPPSFFKQHASGNLANRISSVDMVVMQLEQAVFGTALTGLFSLLYIVQMITFAPKMIVPTFCVIFASFLGNLAIARISAHRTQEVLELEAQGAAMSNAIIGGIQKIRLAGAEKRFFSAWAEGFAKRMALAYGHPGILMLETPLTTLISTAGLVVIYLFALGGGIQDAATFMAFSSAYGLASSTVNEMLLQMLSSQPYLKMIEPLLQAVPEDNGGKARVEQLRGGVALKGVTFGYHAADKPLFENLSLEVRPGEYVGIVGKTGCGKSTVMRLMLGFETPSRGAVLFDGCDASTLDPTSLRRQIGVVLQNGTLLPGSIYDNIRIAMPELTLEQAWEAARLAGLADDIEAMPMGMMTVVSDGGGGISGGQRQRIMIARAVAGKPKILLFDEATSALDNITQKQVAESLAELQCTRIVIAHRLSTVRDCDRILVLDRGRIAEEGSYDELVARNGLFAELVERQLA